MQSTSETASSPAPRWQPISARERRVLGVLVEKAKTTPDAYPLTLNGLVAGANQKNNRYPLMHVEPDDLQPALDHLRSLGAIGLVQGGGRAEKYRHYAYEWLGVDKVELAVMTELLLRGAQTEGELRGRAARMEPIPDLAALRPVLASLKSKNLILSLTPEGRGHVLTHALYEPRELEKLRAEAIGGGALAPADEGSREVAPPPSPTHSSQTQPSDTVLQAEVAALRRDLLSLQAEFERLRDQFDRLTS